MRYFKEIRWRLSSDAAKSYLGVARKVLQGLLDRVSSAGVKVGARTVTLEDGTVVRVLSVGNVPIVEIKAARDTRTPPESIRECSMFMESGQLDLGATVASLATDSAATITFNARTAHNARFNGEIKVQEINGGQSYRVVDGAALPDDGSTTVVDDVLGEDESVLVTRAAKKTAQFLLPASCWSGLMRRFVQAKYGFPGAVYGSVSQSAYHPDTSRPASATPALQVTAYDGEVVGTLDMNFRNHQCDGIVDLGLLDLWFVRIKPYVEAGGPTVEFRRALYTDCAEMLRQHLIKLGRAHPDFHKLSTFMLSQTFPSLTASVIRDLPADHVFAAAAGPYGWKFSGTGRAAAIVTVTPEDVEVIEGFDAIRHGDFYLHQMTFSYFEADGLPTFSISSTSAERAWIDTFVVVPCVYTPEVAFRREIPTAQSWENYSAFEETFINDGGFFPPVFDYDIPVYCWYDEDTLVVARCDFATVTPSGEFVESACYDGTSASTAPSVSPYFGDSAQCPCVECPGDDTSCDSGSSAWTRVVRHGFYTSYYAGAKIYETYPAVIDTQDSSGQSCFGFMARQLRSSEAIPGADSVFTSSSGGLCAQAGVKDRDCYGDEISAVPSPVLDRVECSNGIYLPELSASSTTTSRFRTRSTYAAIAYDGANSRCTQLIIPQYDASSVVLKDYYKDSSVGSGSQLVGATFNFAYDVSGACSGDTHLEFCSDCAEGTCAPGDDPYNIYSNSYEHTYTRSFCAEYSDCGTQPFADQCRFEGGTSGSLLYSYFSERLESFLVARGQALQLDDKEFEYASQTAFGAYSAPSCALHWAPPGGSSGSRMKFSLAAFLGNTYTDANGYFMLSDALTAIARVWQSDGGDFASSESLQYWRLENPIVQHAGYSAKTQELFSFIGWA